MQAMKMSAPRGKSVMLTIVASVMFFGVAMVKAQEAPAAAAAPLQSDMKAYLVEKGEDGQELLTEVNQVKPGQIIEYTLRYSNVSDADLAEVNIVGPVPQGTVYLAGTAINLGATLPQFSIDGGTTYKNEPVTYKVKMADGSEVERVAAPDMYTHVRWLLERMISKQELTLKYRVQVR
ncbi:MAG: hypothetical protein ACOX9E_14010 [Lentisphaeria bacterium]|jgi:uncharacterized repeat protein (TIGR01451 family)